MSIKSPPTNLSSFHRDNLSRVSQRSRQLLHDVVGGDAFAGGVVVGDDAVAEDGEGKGADFVDGGADRRAWRAWITSWIVIRALELGAPCTARGAAAAAWSQQTLRFVESRLEDAYGGTVC